MLFTDTGSAELSAARNVTRVKPLTVCRPRSERTVRPLSTGSSLP